MRNLLRTGLLAITAVAILGMSQARATIMVVVPPTDTTTDLLVELSWDGVNQPVFNVPGLTNWAVSVAVDNISIPDSPNPPIDIVSYSLTLQHLGGGGLAGVSNAVLSSFTGTVVSMTSVAHAPDAYDKYIVTFERISSTENYITISGQHIVPEPSTALLSLVGLGLIAGAAVARRRGR